MEALQESENQKTIRLNRPQWGFMKSTARFPAFVGAWGTGKSMTAILKVMDLSDSYSGNMGMIFRREFTDLRDSTMKDFRDYTGLIPNSSRDVVRPNGSVIMFRHIEELRNIQNVNLGWFWIEQAEELDTDDQFFMLFGRMRRKGVPHHGIITANTNGQNWIHKLWKAGELQKKLGQVQGKNKSFALNFNGKVAELFESNTWENEGVLEPDFLAGLKLLETTKPKVYQRYVMNSWEESDVSDVIIQPELVRKAINRDLNLRPPIRRLVSIDVARYGDDKTVFYALEGGDGNEVDVLGKEKWEKRSTMETVGLALRFAAKHKIESFAVDEIGVGGGVIDRLEELGKNVERVNSSRKPIMPGKAYNIRAEMYQHGAERFESGRVSIPDWDDELIEELSWAKYKVIKSSGMFLVEPKDDIKERHGRSPDSADAYLGGLWAMPKIPAVVRRDAYDREPEMTLNPMTV